LQASTCGDAEIAARSTDAAGAEGAGGPAHGRFSRSTAEPLTLPRDIYHAAGSGVDVHRVAAQEGDELDPGMCGQVDGKR
jgi:hypothetical protein